MKMVSFLLIPFEWICILYLAACTGLYAFQEKVIFHPVKLDAAYVFEFEQPFREKIITMPDGTALSACLFPSDSSRGLIFHLHGNTGSLKSWGSVAKVYTDLGYDILMFDYRGFGKSEGGISSQDQLFSDVQTVYDTLLKIYCEEDIIVMGYSIGSGIAAHLASTNNPKLLILEAPYYSLVDMMERNYSWVPVALLKYRIETFRYLRNCEVPVVVFHGDADQSIPYSSSVRLREEFKSDDILVTLKGQGHSGVEQNADYQRQLTHLLAR